MLQISIAFLVFVRSRNGKFNGVLVYRIGLSVVWGFVGVFVYFVGIMGGFEFPEIVDFLTVLPGSWILH